MFDDTKDSATCYRLQEVEDMRLYLRDDLVELLIAVAPDTGEPTSNANEGAAADAGAGQVRNE